jgi:hypothetical protein
VLRRRGGGGARGVHGDVAAADDHDALAGQVDGGAELDGAQELEAAETPSSVLAGHAQRGRARRAGRDEDGVEAVGLERGQVVTGELWRSRRRCAVTLAMSCSTTSCGRR